MKFRCVLFDLDGTLVDTIDDIVRTMNRALEAAGFPPRKREEFPALVGRGIKNLAFDCLPPEARGDENAARVADAAEAFYREEPVVHSKPYPGILPLLAELSRRKVRRAVLSNKPDAVACLVIGNLFPPETFSLVQGELPGVPRKPDPAAAWDLLVKLGCTPRETILAGDSEVDMETARNIGCFPLGVSWGFRSPQVLEKAGAARIIGRPEELLGLIRETRM
ncbi:MAG: HAD family hydrolase [Treponema sp.]|jgi:phosphoglycolate phosphatase|nr:HAD family hydrolase [Treponema sp.]